MLRINTAVTGVLLVGAVGTARAQSLGVELRAGAAVPTADLGEAALANGAGFEVNGNYRVLPHVLLYAGWNWHGLATDEPFAGNDYDVEATGYAFGAQFRHPMAGAVSWWARAGATIAHLELEDEDGEIVADSGHEPGWEAGVGLHVPVGAVALTPGIRYRQLATEVDVGTGEIPVDFNFLAFEVGVEWRFGPAPATAATPR